MNIWKPKVEYSCVHSDCWILFIENNMFKYNYDVFLVRIWILKKKAKHTSSCHTLNKILTVKYWIYLVNSFYETNVPNLLSIDRCNIYTCIYSATLRHWHFLQSQHLFNCVRTKTSAFSQEDNTVFVDRAKQSRVACCLFLLPFTLKKTFFSTFLTFSSRKIWNVTFLGLVLKTSIIYKYVKRANTELKTS